MKRKILLLLILFATPTMTLSETSCSCSLFGGKDKTELEIVDISEKKFDNWSPNDISIRIEGLYNEVRRQIGSWAKPEIATDDLKADDNITILVYYNGAYLSEISNSLLYAAYYNIKVTILENDEYFITQEETDYSFKVE